MSLHVICPGCLKRFQVGERFAGKQGPCPSCGTIITIPKESVKMHDDDNTTSAKEKKRKDSLRPIAHLNLEFDPVRAKYYASGVFGVLLLTFLVGCLPMYAFLRSFLGLLVLCLVAFPLVLFGYQTLRDREEMFALTGKELYRRAGIVSAGYVILWCIFECFLSGAYADMLVCWLYLAAFATLSTLLAHPFLDMKVRDAFLHYCLFGFSVVLLRFLLGLGWFWESSELIRNSVAPQQPILFGM